MARLKDGGANIGLRAALLEHAIEIRDAICAPPPTPIDGRPPAKSGPELDAALWQAFGAPVDQLAAGEEVLIHRYDLPDWHPERDAGLPGDYIVFGADDVLRPFEARHVSQLGKHVSRRG
jgi:hypothetical protein